MELSECGGPNVCPKFMKFLISKGSIGKHGVGYDNEFMFLVDN